MQMMADPRNSMVLVMMRVCKYAKKIVAELIVFLAREGRVAPAGERGSPTLCFV